MRYDLFRSMEWGEPFVKIGENQYRWVTLGVDDIVRISDSGPDAAVVARQLVEAPGWVVGSAGCRRIGDIDLASKEFFLIDGETLEFAR